MQGVLQQTPWAQMPVAQSALDAHGATSGGCPPQAPWTQGTPAHCASLVQLAKQELVALSQAKGAQTRIGPGLQPPWPSQTPWERETPRHCGGPQAVPAITGAHVPARPGSAHDMQSPLQGLLQHTPCAHTLLRQSPFEAHGSAGSRRATQEPPRHSPCQHWLSLVHRERHALAAESHV
jgi:hypothetical protein